jgi:hypothetical protein
MLRSQWLSWSCAAVSLLYEAEVGWLCVVAWTPDAAVCTHAVKGRWAPEYVD